MKILIPDKIKKSAASSTEIKLVLNHKTKQNSINIRKEHALKCPFVSVNVAEFDDILSIQYEVVAEQGSYVYKFDHKNHAIYRNLSELTLRCLKKQVTDTFEDSNEGRFKCLEVIDEKIMDVECLDEEVYGTKNLIYYSIYFDNGYCNLLNKSIESLLKYSDPNSFDILLITDKQTQALIIEGLSFFQKKKPLFLLTETPADGVDASKEKLSIFDYEQIKEYKNILFVDCDVLFLRDVGQILNQKLNPNTLYTAGNSNLTYNFHKSIHHGFEFLPQEHITEMTIAKQMPFNAGQFLFRNSRKIKEHFENVRWFMKNWSGEYFFEQCFMNYYFCKAYLTNPLLNSVASIISTVDENLQSIVSEEKVFVHFIAPPLEAAAKLEFIDNFEQERTT